MRPAGGNHRTLRKYVDQIWQIPTDHFDPDRARNEALQKGIIPLSQVLVESSTYARGHLKARLFKEGLKTPSCEMCGQGEIWNGRRMAVILDHINGVADDNRIENLRIVCPNCAGTLDTHCGRQNRLQREPRECPTCGGEFLPAYAAQNYCSRYCGVRRRGDGRPMPTQRKVERPPYTHLLREIGALGYAGTGRRYGVSDNAIRKWVRQYERELGSSRKMPA
jgi:ribosomal protein S27AE